MCLEGVAGLNEVLRGQKHVLMKSGGAKTRLRSRSVLRGENHPNIGVPRGGEQVQCMSQRLKMA